MHLPTTARRPISSSASNTTSVSCTVSIVSAVVVPLRRSSAAARRADARSVRRRVRRFHRPHAAPQPFEQRHVVGVAAEERLAQVDVGLDEAGEQVRAAGVDHGVVRLGRFRADRRDPSVTDRHRSLHDVAAHRSW